MKDDYIEAARARGIDEHSVVYHHAFRNALVPVITSSACTVALLLGGAVLTETTFNWPGLGHELVNYLAEPRLRRRPGDHRRLRPRRGRRQPDHRLRQRLHRPEDPLLMAAPETPPRLLARASARRVARSGRSRDARGAGRVMLWVGIGITMLLHPHGGLRARDLAVQASTSTRRTGSASRSSTPPSRRAPDGHRPSSRPTCSRASSGGRGPS